MSSKRITLIIDDMDVTVPDGMPIFEAARMAGIDIPHLCYDPELRLPPTSSCRLCVVEVEGARVPVASCSHPVSQGLVVRTDSEHLREMRRLVIGLLLSDHPHDCLTCEKTGDCALQEYAYEFGVKESPYLGDAVHAKPIQDGPFIVYDRSKCILCGRCVAVCHDVQVAGAIDFFGRGFDTTVSLPPGESRDESVCEECGNCLDVCPTGALSFAGAVGSGRIWKLGRTVTTCGYCGVGCTLVLHTRDNRVIKVTGEPGLGINEGRLCVKGRFGTEFIHHPDRLTQPLIRRDGRLQPVSWDEALDYVAAQLTQTKSATGPDAIGFMSSSRCTNEDNYLFQKLARAAVGTNNVDQCART